MARARAEQARKRWEAVVARWRKSGTSMLAYCRAQELSYSQLVRWRRRIEDEVGTTKSLTLIPVVRQPATRASLIVRLPGGIEIELDSGFDSDLLVAAVHALQEIRRC